MQTNRDVLEVEQNFDDVFLQTLECRVLMQHAVDFDLSNRRAGNRRQQHAPQRVTEGMTETAFQRLDHDTGAISTGTFNMQAARAQDGSRRMCHELRSPKETKIDFQRRWTLSVYHRYMGSNYFEYNSTIRL